MIDIFMDGVSLKEIQQKDKQLLRFINSEKDESITISVTDSELVNIYNRIKMRCETLNLIPIVNQN